MLRFNTKTNRRSEIKNLSVKKIVWKELFTPFTRQKSIPTLIDTFFDVLIFQRMSNNDLVCN